MFARVAVMTAVQQPVYTCTALAVRYSMLERATLAVSTPSAHRKKLAGIVRDAFVRAHQLASAFKVTIRTNLEPRACL